MFTFSQSPATASLNSLGLIHSRTLPYRSHRDGGWPDHFRLKYTQVLSQQIVFTQSPSLSNNPKILNNYLVFAEMVDDKVEVVDKVTRMQENRIVLFLWWSVWSKRWAPTLFGVGVSVSVPFWVTT